VVPAGPVWLTFEQAFAHH